MQHIGGARRQQGGRPNRPGQIESTPRSPCSRPKGVQSSLHPRHMSAADNSTVSSLCHLWLTPTHCPEAWWDRKTIHDAVWLSLIVLVCIAFEICSIRRWLILRKFQLNAHSMLDINIHMTFLSWIPFYGMSLGRVTSVLWLKSLLYYGGYTLLCSSIAIIVAAVLQLEKPVAFRHRSVSFLRWPPLLVAAYVIFLIVTTVTSIGQGIISENDVWYRVSYPVYLGSVSIFFWCDISVLAIGAWKIKLRLKAAMATQGTKTLTGDLKRVDQELNIIIVGLCGLILLPASIGTAILACGASYSDSHYWSTEALYSFFQFMALTYIVYWCVLFWKAGTRRLEGSQQPSYASSQFSAGSVSMEKV